MKIPGTVRSIAPYTHALAAFFPFFLPGAGVSDLETALARAHAQALTHHLAIRASRQLSGLAATCARFKACGTTARHSIHPANGPPEQAFASKRLSRRCLRLLRLSGTLAHDRIRTSRFQSKPSRRQPFCDAARAFAVLSDWAPFVFLLCLPGHNRSGSCSAVSSTHAA